MATGAAARTLRGPAAARPRLEGRVSAQRAAGSHRSPYRVADETLYIVDQRELPERIVELRCGASGDVMAAIRSKAVYGAAVSAQVAAYGLWLSAVRGKGRDGAALHALLAGAAAALREVGAGIRPLAVAVDRMEARRQDVREVAEDDVIAEELRREADAIAMEAMLDHARLGRVGAAIVPQPADRPLEILTLGSTGALSAGMVGTALAVVQAIAAEGRRVHVWVMETRPFLEGARLTALELSHAGIPHTVIADTAAGWVLANEPVDAVLVGADLVAANGETIWTVGSYSTAVLASRANVPFYVCASTVTFDVATPAAPSVARWLGDETEVASIRGVRLGPAPENALNPLADLIPADLIEAFVTEDAIRHPPLGSSLRTTGASADRDTASAGRGSS